MYTRPIPNSKGDWEKVEEDMTPGQLIAPMIVTLAVLGLTIWGFSKLFPSPAEKFPEEVRKRE